MDAKRLLGKVNKEYGAREESMFATTQRISNQRLIAVEARLIQLQNQLDRADESIESAGRLGKTGGMIDPEDILSKKKELYDEAVGLLERAAEIADKGDHGKDLADMIRRKSSKVNSKVYAIFKHGSLNLDEMRKEEEAKKK